MSDTYVDVRQVNGQGMISLRADLSDARVKKAVKAATGFPVPEMTSCTVDGMSGLAWMSPDELLVLCPDVDCAQMVAGLQKQLAKLHHLAVDVSDARAVFELEGAHIREVIAKLTPTDTHADALKTSDFRRTRFGQVAGAFWLPHSTKARIICFRSVGDYMHKMLLQSAQNGSQVAL